MVARRTLSLEAIEAQYGKTMSEAAKALGADDLHVEEVSSEKIFQENILLPQPEALEQGKKAMVKNRITNSEKKYKTAPITLSQEAIEDQYGKTMTEAATALEADDFFEDIFFSLPEASEQGKKAMVNNRITTTEKKYKTAKITLSQEAIEAQYGKTMTEAAAALEGDDLPQENILLPQPEALEQGKKPMVKNCITNSEKKYKTTPITLSQDAIEAQCGKTMTEAAAALEADDFQENIFLPQPEALEQGKKALVKNRITASEKKYKTAPITLSQEAIEAQYGKTMSEATAALEVSLSTLKRKCKAVGISEWQGPSPTRRKVNNSSNQSAKNEEYDGAVQDSSPINKNENTLTIKAKYKEDTIKFHLSISEATLIIVEEKIGKKCNLTHGTYKLNYLDEDAEWILLASDEDMSDCMKSSRILGQNVVRLRVLPISG